MIRRSFLLILLMLLCYGYVLPRWADWSQTSRLALIRALVEQGTVRIDMYVDSTGDYALIGGHAYSDKAPGTAFLAVPFYVVIRPILQIEPVRRWLGHIAKADALVGTVRKDGAGLGSERIELAMSHYLLTMLVIALPTAISVAAFDWLLRRWFQPGPALLGAIGVGLATPLTPYGANFYSHALVAALLVLAWALIESQAKHQAVRFGVAGTLLGLALISEYPVALICAVIGLYSLWKHGWRSGIWLTVGSLPALALLVGYDLVAFGTPWPVGYAYSALWQEQHHSGFMSLTYPHPTAMWGLLGSNFRGLFFRAPWLLLALPGAALWWRSAQHRAVLALTLGAALALWLFYSSSRMWWGGFAAGPRYIAAAIPFLCVPAVFLIDRWWMNRIWRCITISLVILSLMLVWAEMLAGQQFPPDTLSNPWVSWTVTAWNRGDIARNVGMGVGLHGAWSLVPLAIGATVLTLFLCKTPDRPLTTREVQPIEMLR